MFEKKHVKGVNYSTSWKKDSLKAETITPHKSYVPKRSILFSLATSQLKKKGYNCTSIFNM